CRHASLARTRTSTPFPYTTLFRSQLLRHRERGLAIEGIAPARAAQLDLGGAEVELRHQAPRALGIVGEGGVLALGQVNLGTTEIDRKSTRLNSSHVAISYAVFCLK